MPPAALTVRPVEPSELDAVAELTVGVYLGGGFSTAEYEPQLRDVAGRVAAATVLVAVLDGALAGTATVATQGGRWAELAVPGDAVIRMLAVAPGARGAGVGEALVRSCVEQARAAPCSVVRLSSQEDMQAAHRLYDRLGFVRTPSFDWSPIPGLQLRTYALVLADWCGTCGKALTPEGHEACRRSAALEPPRYCATCRRRMVVQVLPGGWTARCSEHGLRAG